MKLRTVHLPGSDGPPLHLHPQVTVLVGATDPARRTLQRVVRAIAGGPTPGVDGEVDINGVILPLADALDRLDIRPGADPVIALAETVAAPPIGPRGELATLSTRLSELGVEIVEAAHGLDAPALAALDAAQGRVEAARAQARAALDATAQQRRRRIDTLSEQLRAAHDELAQLDALDEGLGVISSLRTRLQAAIQGAETAEDQRELADRLDRAMWTLRDLESRRMSADIRLAEASQRLADATAAVAAAAARDEVDQHRRSTAQRLEAVRDEAEQLAQQRGGRAVRRRRVLELRVEEAVLLDRLGFDTYAAYVVGIAKDGPVDDRTEEPASGHDANAALAAVEAEVAELRAGAPDDAEIRAAIDALADVLDDAATVVGRDHVPVLRGDVVATGDAPATPGRWQPVSDVELSSGVYDLVARLRGHSAGAVSGDDPAVRAAVAASIVALAQLGVQGVGDTSSATEVLEALAECERRGVHAASQRTRAREQVAALDAQMEQLTSPGELDDSSHRHLVVARTELRDAQERAGRHRRAQQRLETLRADQAQLRRRERELLDELAASAAAAPVSDPLNPAGQRGADAATSALPPPFRGSAAGPSTHADPVWALTARLAELHHVSFLGALPVLVAEMPDDAQHAEAVAASILRFGAIAQIVVLAGLGDDVAWRRWARERDAETLLQVIAA